MLKCLVFLFLIVTWLQCSVKAVKVAYGNSFSNQWAFTMYAGNRSFHMQHLNFYIAKKNYVVYFVEICTVDVK